MKLTVNFWQYVKQANRNFLPVLLSLVLLTTAAIAKSSSPPANAKSENPSTSETSVVPSVSFKRMWIDYNVMQGGIKGMRIHTNFEVYNMKGIAGYLALYFQDNNGDYLQDNNDKFVSGNNEVAVYFEINPGFNPTTVYEDAQVFMPYDELDLSDGKYSLKIDAKVIYKQGGVVGNLTIFNFDYTQGAPVTTTTTGGASATFEKLWVDYDVMVGGQRGMRVHVKFTVVGMRGTPARLAVFFQKKDGTKLYTSNRAYRSTDAERAGELVVYFDLNPGYERTVYEDLSVFLPYKELEAILSRGTYDLQIDADVVYKNGAIVNHLELEDFWFERF